MAAILWVPEDCGDFDPDTVDWGAVEDRGVEIGHEVIDMTGSPYETHYCEPCGMDTRDDDDPNAPDSICINCGTYR